MGSSTARGPSSPSHFGGRVLPSLQLHEIGASEFDPFIAVGTEIFPRPPHSPEQATWQNKMKIHFCKG